MTVKAKNNKKRATVKVVKRLDKLKDKVLFPEKLEKANKMLKESPIPRKLLRTAK